MNRRNSLKALAAITVARLLDEAAPASVEEPVQLHMDLDVDPALEAEFISSFDKVFAPIIRNHPGLQELKLMKVRQQASGTAPHGPYRAILGFQSKKLWAAWVASTDHTQRAWPSIA
jgi:hypothetical protein